MRRKQRHPRHRTLKQILDFTNFNALFHRSFLENTEPYVVRLVLFSFRIIIKVLNLLRSRPVVYWRMRPVEISLLLRRRCRTSNHSHRCQWMRRDIAWIERQMCEISASATQPIDDHLKVTSTTNTECWSGIRIIVTRSKDTRRVSTASFAPVTESIGCLNYSSTGLSDHAVR